MFDPSRVRVCGPLAEFAPGFVRELERVGYTPLSAALQVRLAAGLSRWLADRGLGAADLSAAMVEQFVADRRAGGARQLTTARAVEPLLAYLAGVGVLGPRPAPVTDPVEALLADFDCYLMGERGLGAATRRGYCRLVQPFLVGRVGPDGRVDAAGLRAGDVTSFVLAAAPGRAPASAKLLVTALRSLLGFLHVDGQLRQPLSEVVPSVAGYRLAGLPRALEPDQVQRLLAGCDRGTGLGRRERAVLVMCVRMGLRPGEVASLSLDDIDWRAGEVRVHGKGSRLERLPLPADVGEAIVDYLQGGRPQTAQGRWLIVRWRAPHGPLSTAGIGDIVNTAGTRAGLANLSPRVLRHTAATSMVRAGAPLGEVGQVLRHSRLITTAIYAKLDRESLRGIAKPWPGTLS